MSNAPLGINPEGLFCLLLIFISLWKAKGKKSATFIRRKSHREQKKKYSWRSIKWNQSSSSTVWGFSWWSYLIIFFCLCIISRDKSAAGVYAHPNLRSSAHVLYDSQRKEKCLRAPFFKLVLTAESKAFEQMPSAKIWIYLKIRFCHFGWEGDKKLVKNSNPWQSRIV